MAYVATRRHHLDLTLKILAEIFLPSTNWTAWDNRCEVKKNANQFLISFYPLLSSLVVSPITFEVSIDMIDGKEQREIRPINSIFAEFFWGESWVLIGYPIGQDGPILTALQSLITPRKKAFSLGHMVNDAFLGIGWWDVGLGVKELHNSGDHGSETGVTKCGLNFIAITCMHLMQCEIFRRHKIC